MTDLHFRVSKSFLHLMQKQAEALNMQSPEMFDKIRALEKALLDAHTNQDKTYLVQTSKDIIDLGEVILKGKTKQDALG